MSRGAERIIVRELGVADAAANTRAERLYDFFGFRQFGLEPDAFFLDGRYCAKQHRQLILDSFQHHE
ncbi:hypothetical protein [Massilia horti]|uniref:Acetyltransferase n=1 Tax=Massilia horti TaxID=2562153 RepID=A0A4Y9SPF9_9BURK|nr:hypothetical protein [Massilia horti]TFW28385.1 hypothetical protein E4O92_21410 [Massilia horti]